MAEFQGTTCSNLCFIHWFSYISLRHMDPHFSINQVLQPTWLRTFKNRNSYPLSLHLLAKRVSQPPPTCLVLSTYNRSRLIYIIKK